MKNKYNARKVRADGHIFDSQLEYKHYCDLKLLQQGKIIEGLVVHPKFDAVVNGTHVCFIVLDFQYWDKETNRLVYIDTKGFYTSESRLRHKLLRALYPDVDLRIITK